MVRHRWVLAVAAMAVAPLLAFAADTKDTKDRKDKIPPEVEKLLKANFDQADQNKDGELDTTELAKSFRGPSAKPPPEPKPGDKPIYPDQIFLLNVDADKDGKISFDEYKASMKEIAEDLLELQKENEKLQNKIIKHEKRLLEKLNNNDRAAVERELKAYRNDVQKQQIKMLELMQKAGQKK